MDYKKIIMLVYILSSIILVVFGIYKVLLEKTYPLTVNYYPPFSPILAVNPIFIAGGIFGLIIVYFVAIKREAIVNEKSVEENVPEVFPEK